MGARACVHVANIKRIAGLEVTIAIGNVLLTRPMSARPSPPVHPAPPLQELSRRLLAEQNAEYEASLAADREREARRQEEAARAADEARQRAEEEARVR